MDDEIACRMAPFPVSMLLEGFSVGKIKIAICQNCGSHQAIPGPSCLECGSTDRIISEHDGKGSIFSWVTCNYSFTKTLNEEVPYTVVLIDLAGGGRVYGRIENVDPSALHMEMQVELDRERTRARNFPVFVPA